MLLFVLLAVFIGGLMVGRTPEYLGKKIEAREIKLVLDRHPVHAAAGAVRAPRWRSPATYGRRRSTTPARRASRRSLYAYMSQANNNGSAFAGYTGFIQPNAPGNLGAHGVTLRRPARRPGDALRPLRADPRRARRRRLARRQEGRPGRRRHLRTDSPTFVVLLIGVIVLVAALTFFPALLLGPSSRA